MGKKKKIKQKFLHFNLTEAAEFLARVAIYNHNALVIAAHNPAGEFSKKIRNAIETNSIIEPLFGQFSKGQIGDKKIVLNSDFEIVSIT